MPLPALQLVLHLTALGAVFLLGGLHALPADLAWVYASGLGVWLTLDLVRLPRRAWVEVRRDLPQRAGEGEAVSLTYSVKNRSGRGLHFQMAEALGESLEVQPSGVERTLAPYSEAEVKVRLTASRRGRHELNLLDLRLRRRWGLLWKCVCVRTVDSLEVLPGLAEMRRHELDVRRGLLVGRMSYRAPTPVEGTEFESLREYVPGDRIASMDWKATAKKNVPIVRSYQPERDQSVIVAIDAGRATAGQVDQGSRLDRFITATCLLAHVVLRQGDWFSVVGFSDRIEAFVPPVRHHRRLELVLMSLMNLQSRMCESDYDAACRFLSLRGRKRSLVCLMTDVIDRHANADVIGYLGHFARMHLPLLVTLSDPSVSQLAHRPVRRGVDPYRRAAALDVLHARAEAIEVMRHRGVGVLEVEPNQLNTGLIRRYLQIKARRRL